MSRSDYGPFEKYLPRFGHLPNDEGWPKAIAAYAEEECAAPAPVAADLAQHLYHLYRTQPLSKANSEKLAREVEEWVDGYWDGMEALDAIGAEEENES